MTQPPDWVQQGRTGPGPFAPKIQTTDARWKGHPSYEWHHGRRVTTEDIRRHDPAWYRKHVQQQQRSGGIGEPGMVMDGSWQKGGICGFVFLGLVVGGSSLVAALGYGIYLLAREALTPSI